jgi:Ni/Fe-hydrogenase subunit HybB-like protein
MNVDLLYNIHIQETFGIYIAIYFYLTGLSAGSFFISTLGYSFGLKEFKPLGKIGAVMATILLAFAPMFLLFHVGRPLKPWHLFAYINFTSPLSWGSFFLTSYLAVSVGYAYLLFKGDMKRTKIFGLVGLSLAIGVDSYTGFVLAVAKARALWNTAVMPILFVVSALVSGIAIMILASYTRDRFFTKDKLINTSLLYTMGTMLGGAIILDLFLVLSDIIVLLTAHTEAKEAADLLLYQNFSPFFVVMENLCGKIIPLIIIITPPMTENTSGISSKNIIYCINISLDLENGLAQTWL